MDQPRNDEDQQLVARTQVFTLAAQDDTRSQMAVVARS